MGIFFSWNWSGLEGVFNWRDFLQEIWCSKGSCSWGLSNEAVFTWRAFHLKLKTTCSNQRANKFTWWLDFIKFFSKTSKVCNQCLKLEVKWWSKRWSTQTRYEQFLVTLLNLAHKTTSYGLIHLLYILNESSNTKSVLKILVCFTRIIHV